MKANYYTQKLIDDLQKHAEAEKVKLWSRVADDLKKPSSKRRVVNLSKISRFTKENETIIVPGKVLATGELKHKVNIAAFNFSEQAKEKILQAKGNAYSIEEFMKTNPKAKQTRIIG